MDRAIPESVIYTIGYEGTQIDQLTKELVSKKILALIDVRKNAISRKKGFSKTRLSDEMQAAGIEYIHMPELGIPSSLRKELDVSRPQTYASLFDYYDESILPEAADSVLRIMELAQKTNGVSAGRWFSSGDRKLIKKVRLIFSMFSLPTTANLVG